MSTPKSQIDRDAACAIETWQSPSYTLLGYVQKGLDFVRNFANIR